MLLLASGLLLLNAEVEAQQPQPPGVRRQSRWYVLNDRPRSHLVFANSTGAATGFFPCCGGWTIDADGTFHGRNYTGGELREDDDWAPILAAGLSVHPSGGVHASALFSGGADAAIPAAVEWVVAQNLTGLNADVEFSGNASEAAIYASFLSKITAALKAKGKEMLWYSGGWGGIKYYDIMAPTGAFAVDGSFYYMNGTGSSSALPNSRQVRSQRRGCRELRCARCFPVPESALSTFPSMSQSQPSTFIIP